jgi:hypothetical protein
MNEAPCNVTRGKKYITAKDFTGLWQAKFDKKKILAQVEKKKLMKQEYIWKICDEIKDALTLNL